MKTVMTTSTYGPLKWPTERFQVEKPPVAMEEDDEGALGKGKVPHRGPMEGAALPHDELQDLDTAGEK